ncbi:hypothetical protein AF2641_09620 [Anoxybacillus flavithermus]|nr:hypothetical protein AF2641_09620 [Anoxybacillus flavithermus]
MICLSFPNIPNIKPDIDLDEEDVLSLLLASIALEELSLAHIMNAEAEKLQAVLGSLTTSASGTKAQSLHDLLKVNRSVERTLRTVLKNQMLLQFKLEDVSDLIQLFHEQKRKKHKDKTDCDQ